MTNDAGLPGAPRFDVVLRGYDRRQVDEHVQRLQRVVARMRADLDAGRGRVAGAGAHPLAAKLGPVPEGEGDDQIGNFTDRMNAILQEAEQEAAEIRRNAHHAARAETDGVRAQVADLMRQRDNVLTELTRMRAQLEALLAAPTASMPPRPGPGFGQRPGPDQRPGFELPPLRPFGASAAPAERARPGSGAPAPMVGAPGAGTAGPSTGGPGDGPGPSTGRPNPSGPVRSGSAPSGRSTDSGKDAAPAGESQAGVNGRSTTVGVPAPAGPPAAGRGPAAGWPEAGASVPARQAGAPSAPAPAGRAGVGPPDPEGSDAATGPPAPGRPGAGPEGRGTEERPTDPGRPDPGRPDPSRADPSRPDPSREPGPDTGRPRDTPGRSVPASAGSPESKDAEGDALSRREPGKPAHRLPTGAYPSVEDRTSSMRPDPTPPEPAELFRTDSRKPAPAPGQRPAGGPEAEPDGSVRADAPTVLAPVPGREGPPSGRS